MVKLLEIIDETFDGVFQGEMPSHTEISNWAKKNGLATYADSGKRLSGMKYCEIIDECITVGNQKVLLTLAAPSVPKGHPLRHEDVSPWYCRRAFMGRGFRQERDRALLP